MKRNRFLAACTLIGLALTGCSGNTSQTAAPATVAPATVTEETTKGAAENGAETSQFKGEMPVVITSAGQSADFEMIKVMFDKNELEYSANSVVTEEDLGDCRTLIVAIGGSSKGLGAAGIDADAELARVEKLLKAAKEKEIKIVAAHIGGSGRRGKLGDRYIAPCVNAADYVIVVEEGNEDGLFTQLTSDNNIPMDSVSNMTDVIPLIKAMFE